MGTGVTWDLKTIRETSAEALHGGDRDIAEDVRGVETPDQTRHDGMRTDIGTISHAETSGDFENRARKGNLTDM